MAIPPARDRDNAFFTVDGIIPTVVASKNIQPRLQSFEKEIDYIRGLVYPFDRYFLQNTPEEIFVSQARFIQNELTDEVIHKAFQVWPSEIYKLHGKEITAKVKARRSQLVEYAIAFKHQIDTLGVLKEALKGSGEEELSAGLLACFECE